MYCYRVTKYNPDYRDEFGAYTRDDWTAISDIGEEFNKKTFKMEGYLRVENLCVDAVIRMMECVGVKSLMVIGLEKYYETPRITAHHEIYTERMVQLYQNISENLFVTDHDLQDLCKLVLRESLYLGLVFEDKMYVHFGYDYYNYIGIDKECKNAIDSIQAKGLFVEECESPYFREDDD